MTVIAILHTGKHVLEHPFLQLIEGRGWQLAESALGQPAPSAHRPNESALPHIAAATRALSRGGLRHVTQTPSTPRDWRSPIFGGAMVMGEARRCNIGRWAFPRISDFCLPGAYRNSCSARLSLEILSQPIVFLGAGCRIRTRDLLITKHMLP